MAKFYTAVVTAFQENGLLDIEGNCRLYENLIQAGSDGIVLMGSTGEFCALTMEEARTLTDLALRAIAGRMDVIVGASRMIPNESIELANYALDHGANAVILITPWYFKLSDAGIENFYEKTIPHIHGDVYLYNFPGCTSHELSPEIILKLRRKHSNIRGCKDTVKNFEHTRRLCTTILPEFPDFEIYSGYDEFFIPNLLAGGCGCIGGLTNIAPELFAQWVSAFQEGRWQEVASIQKIVNRMMEMFDISSPFLTAVKHAMKLRGILTNESSKAPLVQVCAEEDAKIRHLLIDLNLL